MGWKEEKGEQKNRAQQKVISGGEGERRRSIGSKSKRSERKITGNNEVKGEILSSRWEREQKRAFLQGHSVMFDKGLEPSREAH